MIITRTPFRVSFFGGGTDYPAWYLEHGGAVLATTIDKYCYITCRYLPPFFEHKYRLVYSKIETVINPEDLQHPSARAILGLEKMPQGIEIHHDGDIPARAGLGTSSAFTVGMLQAISALKGQYLSKETLANRAIDLEQNVIGEFVGSQDQTLAAFGGFNHIDFLQDGNIQVHPIILPVARLNELQSHLMLFFTKAKRIASDVAKSQIDNIKNRQHELKQMQDMVGQAMKILSSATNIEEFGKLLHESWQYKRSLSEKVSTKEIDQIYKAAMQEGAIGGKILGAGGGGFILFFVPLERQDAVRERLKDLVYVPFKFENSGSRVVLYQPGGMENV
jgi:D-glycero-alpha-D-manno-heptose-7-phosphate kinase